MGVLFVNDARPGYYAVIPASVRYDDQIPANAKLLYGEISALIGANGFCFASNAYFMQIYGFSDPTVTRLIKKLEDAGYIRRELERDASGQVVRRKIYLSVSMPEIHPPIIFDTTSHQNCGEGPLKNDGYTNTSNTVYIKENKKEKSKFDPIACFASWVEDTFPETTGSGITLGKEDLNQAFARFLEHRHALKKPVKTQATVTALTNKLTKYAGGSIRTMIDLLDTATASGWQSIYPPKDGITRAAPKEQKREAEEWL